MALRIIGGEFRSRALLTPKGEGTRPTRAMVREAVFNLLQGAWPGGAVLDLFAGSGAMGFEALSRGAQRAVFCDRDAEAVRIVKQNAEALGVAGRARVLRADWAQALKALGSQGERFGLVILDPPYMLDAAPVLRAILDAGLLEAQGVVVLEHGAKTPPNPPEGFMLIKSRAYGHTGIALLGIAQEVP
ncbi:MAG TPA: 16S rRNA (guanine(966)-N(2))-methyltransferase RsmD [Candidatus Limnocylindria bacterium]|nr:16S rRNA (guanine(966)-N(2))-methyltransferase RsmD [Candidatus Limnocylindria bacterium]